MVIVRFISTSQIHSVIAVAAVSAEFAAVDMAVTIIPAAVAIAEVRRTVCTVAGAAPAVPIIARCAEQGGAKQRPEAELRLASAFRRRKLRLFRLVVFLFFLFLVVIKQLQAAPARGLLQHRIVDSAPEILKLLAREGAGRIFKSAFITAALQ